MRGGSGAASFAEKVWGNTDSQTNIPGTHQILAKDPLAGSATAGGSSSFNPEPFSGGARKRKGKGKRGSKKGGMALSEAIVPAILLYAARTYKAKPDKNINFNRSRKFRGSRRR